MNEQAVWNSISNISIGTIIAWVAVIIAIASALCTVTIKLYKVFTKYKEIKDNNQKQEEIIDLHEKTLQEIDKSLQTIKKSLDEQKEVNLKQIRHTIVQTCEDALERNEISINKLRSLEEMYGEYVEIFHGNGYVKTLVERARTLKIVGKEE